MDGTAQIILNKKVYPLYVGGSAEKGFEDFKGKGSSVLLEAEVCSEKFGTKDIVWQVEDEKIAGFDKNEAVICGCGERKTEKLQNAKRRIRAKRTGMTYVTASLPDGSSDRCRITVIDNYTRFTVAEIELNTSELELCEGESAQLIPILYPREVFRNGMLDRRLLWKSMNPAVACVIEGRVTAAGPGETDILAESADVGRRSVCHVKVTEKKRRHQDTRSAAVSEKIMELAVGEKRKLPFAGKGTIKWRSQDRYTVRVDEAGVITALSVSAGLKPDKTGMRVQEIPETVCIYATETEGGKVTVYPVRVRERQTHIHSVSVFPCKACIPIGESGEITATVSPSVRNRPEITWICSDEKILQVRPGNKSVYGESRIAVSALREGEVILTATLGEKSAQCRIKVIKKAVRTDKIQVKRYIETDIDQVVKIQAFVSEEAANKKLCWVSSDASTATVDREGNVQGYKAGKCRVYVLAEDSLTEAQKGLLTELRKAGEAVPDAETVEELLKGTVSAECTVLVKEGNNALRNLHAAEEAVTDHSVLLLWNRASLREVKELKEYAVFRNGEKIGVTQKLGFRAEGLQACAGYEFLVEALDYEGNILAKAAVDVHTKKKQETINVLDYGAAGDGRSLDTVFLQRAINECPEGGTVLLPEDCVFVSGALFLKSNMTFQVDGILLGSGNPKDYPRVITKWEGFRKLEQTAETWENSSEILRENHCPYASLINAGGYDEGESGTTGPCNLENLTICGKGQINANGFVLAYHEGPNRNTMKVAARECPVRDASLRGSAIRIHNGRNIYIKDIQVAYAPGWTVHAIYCEQLTFDGMEVVSQGDGDCGQGNDILHRGHIYNGDGIDPESCVHVNIFNTLFTTGDDAVALKSGRNREGNELDKPNAYVRITDCCSKGSLGGFGTGSETAAGSHDLLFQNLWAEDILVSGIWLKTCPFRGGVTEYIQVRDVTAKRCNSPVWIYHGYSIDRHHPNPSVNLPVVRHLVFENVHGDESNELGFRLEGHPDCLIEDVRLRGISAGGRENRISCVRKLVAQD